ncbi:MAG: long-chain fatty acid--CoA ligase [Chloroflexota bacterium]
MKIRPTIAHLYQERVRLSGDGVSYYYPENGRYFPVTWNQAYQTINELALGMWAMGLRHGDRLAIISNSRHEWSAIDQAGLSFGGVVVGIYPTTVAEQVAYILSHSEARIVFLEDNHQLTRLAAVLPTLPALETIVLINPTDAAAGSWLTLDDLRQRGRDLLATQPDLRQQTRDAVQTNDIAALVYTSGTTGLPKGVVLRHRNLFSVCQSVDEYLGLNNGETGVVFLPMAHILQRVNMYLGVYGNIVGYYAADMLKVMETVQAAQPGTFTGVPRVFEKVHARIMAGVAQSPPKRQKIFYGALAAGVARSRYLQNGTAVPLLLRFKYGLYERLVWQKLRHAIFGRNVRYLTSGAAPISKELLEFFHAMGLTLIEGYGLTETSSPITLNHPDRFKFGTVGPPLPGSAVKIGDDGEILLKGPGVFGEYYKNPEATAAAFTEDGWFRSGDIGELDGDGFLRITDRKKNLLITAAGKNIAPAPIENQLMNSPFVSQALVLGDRRKYLVALLTLDGEAMGQWCEQQGKGALSLAEMAADGDVQALVGGVVAEVNGRLASYETIKQFRILPEEFSVANGTLTPSLKLIRKPVEQKYQHLLDEMYA